MYREKYGQNVRGLLDEAEALLLEAGKGAEREGELMRLATVLGDHARAAKHGRNVDLAVFVVIKGMQKGVAQDKAERSVLDVLWDFLVGSNETRIAQQLRATAESVLESNAGYAHYYLALYHGFLDDRREAIRHMGLLAQADFDRYEKAHEDPDIREYVYKDVGTPHFFSTAPKRGKKPKGQ
ncbi:MAG: hypothetical protein IPI35_21175 [Deltaproteobacteria bacterium]|nr:hypothetical protein [Deltaproteobacteria bacterium]